MAHELAEALLDRKLTADLPLTNTEKIANEQRRMKVIGKVEEWLKKGKPEPSDRIAFRVHVEKYVDYCLEEYRDSLKRDKGAKYVLEEKVDFSNYVPEGFGSNDFMTVGDEVLKVIDLKFGQGVRVDADDNPQLKLYALGAVNKYSMMYDFEQIELHIVQPRLDHVSVYRLSVTELLDWAKGTLSERAKLAYAGEGELAAGEHCRFCPAKGTCRAVAKQALSAARLELLDVTEGKAEVPSPATAPTLAKEEIEAILPLLDQLSQWVSGVKEYALAEALRGTQWKGYKLVEGKSNRVITDKDELEFVLLSAEPKIERKDIYESKLRPLTYFEKILPKERFEALVKPLVDKPKGAPTLVPESDKRPAISSAAQAAKELLGD